MTNIKPSKSEDLLNKINSLLKNASCKPYNTALRHTEGGGDRGTALGYLLTMGCLK